MWDAETQAQEVMTNNAENAVSIDALVIVDLADGDGETWFASLLRAAQPWKPRVLTTLAEARVALGEWESCHLLICYRSPVKQLEIALAKDTPPAQAVVNWKESTEALLSLYRRHWKRITLVEQDAAIRKESELLSYLEERTGLTLTVPEHEVQASDGLETQGEQVGSPMYELIAMQLLSMRKSRPLFQELEASTLPLSERADIIQLVENAINSGKSQAQLAEERLAAERRALEAAREELESQVGLTRQELEAEKQVLEERVQDLESQAGLTKQQLEAERLALTSERNKLRSEAGLTKQELEKERKVLLAEKEELQKGNDLIIEQLHKTQEELEQYLLKLKKTETDIKVKNTKLHGFSQRVKQLREELQEVTHSNQQLKIKLETSRAELKKIRNSRSWKITAPLRRKAKSPVKPK